MRQQNGLRKQGCKQAWMETHKPNRKVIGMNLGHVGFLVALVFAFSLLVCLVVSAAA